MCKQKLLQERKINVGAQMKKKKKVNVPNWGIRVIMQTD